MGSSFSAAVSATDKDALNGLKQCLLTKREFYSLRRGDKLDHRDLVGMFHQATIVKKSGWSVFIHYDKFDSKWDIWANFNKNPHAFAHYNSVTQRVAQSHLADCQVGDAVMIRSDPANIALDANDESWVPGQIVARKLGQVQVSFCANSKRRKRWFHLDNAFEIKAIMSQSSYAASDDIPKQRPQSTSRPASRSNGWQRRSGHQHSHGHDHGQSCNHRATYQPRGRSRQHSPQQLQQQVQVQMQDQMVMRTQLLLDDTKQTLHLTAEYLKGANANQMSPSELSLLNQKMTLSLTCFSMKVSGMRKNAKKEGIDFKDAFKSSAAMIRQF